MQEARHKGINVVWFRLLETSQACKTMETGSELLRIWGGHMVSMLCIHEDLNWSSASLCKAVNNQEWGYGPTIPAPGRWRQTAPWGLSAKPSILAFKSQFSETLSQNTRWLQATQSYSASTLLKMFCLHISPSPGLSKHWNHHSPPHPRSFMLLAKEKAESEIAYAANDQETLKKARTPLSSHQKKAPKVHHLDQTKCHLVPS